MGKGFDIVRAMVFVLLLSVVLAFVPIAYGDIKMALLVGAGTFMLSLIITWVLVQSIKKR